MIFLIFPKTLKEKNKFTHLSLVNFEVCFQRKNLTMFPPKKGSTSSCDNFAGIIQINATDVSVQNT